LSLKRVGLVLVWLLIIALVIIVAPVSATDHVINPGDSLQQAINSANSGDTIILNPGTYFENNIQITQNIIIEGSGSPQTTIIDGNQSNTGIFNVTGAYILNIDGLTLRNGQTAGDVASGGAIDLFGDGGTASVSDITIFNCSAVYGGAIYNDGTEGTIAVEDSTISNCTAYNGGAIYNAGTEGTIAITSSTISNCTVTGEGGGAVESFGTVTIQSSTITNCSALGGAGDGGAIYSYANVTVQGSTISGCSADEGGAIFTYGETVFTSISTSTISNCSALEGGAIYADEGSSVTITSSTINGCSATGDGGYSRGGAIYAISGIVTIQSSTTITGCSATGGGGAIYANGCTVTIDNSTISNCSTPYTGGAIWNSGYVNVDSSPTINPSSPSVEPAGGTLSLTSSTITFCSALEGGAIYNNDGTVTIQSSTITNCSALGGAGDGGAIYSTDQGSGTMQFSRIYNDTAEAVVNIGELPPTPSGGSNFPPSTTFTATDNWWGSNANPSGEVSDSVTYNPWLVLGITANPTSITISPIQTSAIQANLTYDSDGNYVIPVSGHVPDGIPVTFGVSLGSIGHVLPLTGTTSNGAAATTFTPANGGTATVSATVDDQQVTAVILISGVPPTTVPPGHHGQSVGGGQPPSGGSSGYTGPAPTQVISNPTLLPTVQPIVSSPVNASAAGTSTFTAPPLPTNTPRSGLDAVPVLGALGLCGVIFLFRKNGN
jgi:hypothetical protein